MSRKSQNTYRDIEVPENLDVIREYNRTQMKLYPAKYSKRQENSGSMNNNSDSAEQEDKKVLSLSSTHRIEKGSENSVSNTDKINKKEKKPPNSRAKDEREASRKLSKDGDKEKSSKKEKRASGSKSASRRNSIDNNNNNNSDSRVNDDGSLPHKSISTPRKAETPKFSTKNSANGKKYKPLTTRVSQKRIQTPPGKRNNTQRIKNEEGSTPREEHQSQKQQTPQKEEGKAPGKSNPLPISSRERRDNLLSTRSSEKEMDSIYDVSDADEDEMAATARNAYANRNTRGPSNTTINSNNMLLINNENDEKMIQTAKHLLNMIVFFDLCDEGHHLESKENHAENRDSKNNNNADKRTNGQEGEIFYRYEFEELPPQFENGLTIEEEKLIKKYYLHQIQKTSRLTNESSHAENLNEMIHYFQDMYLKKKNEVYRNISCMPATAVSLLTFTLRNRKLLEPTLGTTTNPMMATVKTVRGNSYHVRKRDKYEIEHNEWTRELYHISRVLRYLLNRRMFDSMCANVGDDEDEEEEPDKVDDGKNNDQIIKTVYSTVEVNNFKIINRYYKKCREIYINERSNAPLHLSQRILQQTNQKLSEDDKNKIKGTGPVQTNPSTDGRRDSDTTDAASPNLFSENSSVAPSQQGNNIHGRNKTSRGGDGADILSEGNKESENTLNHAEKSDTDEGKKNGKKIGCCGPSAVKENKKNHSNGSASGGRKHSRNEPKNGDSTNSIDFRSVSSNEAEGNTAAGPTAAPLMKNAGKPLLAPKHVGQPEEQAFHYPPPPLLYFSLYEYQRNELVEVLKRIIYYCAAIRFPRFVLRVGTVEEGTDFGGFASPRSNDGSLFAEMLLAERRPGDSPFLEAEEPAPADPSDEHSPLNRRGRAGSQHKSNLSFGSDCSNVLNVDFSAAQADRRSRSEGAPRLPERQRSKSPANPTKSNIVYYDNVLLILLVDLWIHQRCDIRYKSRKKKIIEVELKPSVLAEAKENMWLGMNVHLFFPPNSTFVNVEREENTTNNNNMSTGNDLHLGSSSSSSLTRFTEEGPVSEGKGSQASTSTATGNANNNNHTSNKPNVNAESVVHLYKHIPIESFSFFSL